MAQLGAPLANQYVKLEPLDLARDQDALRDMAEGLGDQVQVWPFHHNGDWVADWIVALDRGMAAGHFILYAVFAPDGAFAGITGYIGLDSTSRNVEIGMTMYGAAYQGTTVNPAAKLLLLGAAFEAGMWRVQINVDDRNARSKAAVLKLGATPEGLLREHRLLPNGHMRSTAVFSILAREWPAVKNRLEARVS